MPKIRVLVVDDSVVARRLVSDCLSNSPEIEVAGIAANGRIALQKIAQCNPDVVTLDVEMPEMDGIQTLKEIRAVYPRLPVIMFSALTERGANATLDALSLGASDYVAKPTKVANVAEAVRRIEEALIPKIKVLCPGFGKTSCIPASAPVPRRAGWRQRSAISPETPIGGVRIVAIGCSTGGPNALADLFPAIPEDFPVPVVVVQHMPPLFTKLLAERLNAKSHIRVHEAADEMLLEKGHAYVAPGDFHMTVQTSGERLVLKLNQDPPENSCRPSVDVLFRSVANVFGRGALGVVLTGMGQDGLRGSELIREAGGQILAQDEATSVVWGMPGFVVRAGLSDQVLPLSSIGPEIVDRVKSRIRRLASSRQSLVPQGG